MEKFFKFNPLLKQTIWGGGRIAPFKHLDTAAANIGESWELSGVAGSETTVAGGPCGGMTTNSLVAEFGAELLGRDNHLRFGGEFPLLVKFIDAAGDLSVQVHPDDDTARRQGRGRGKSEMWYVMDSAPHAKMMIGLKRRITLEEYRRLVADDTVCEAINVYDVKEGDCFYIPAGRIHSIGAGCFLTEIQQTSDVTYRIYDFKRRDKNGNLRQLHTEEAAEAIDFSTHDDYRTLYTPARNRGVELVDCPHFNTAVYDLDEPITLDYSGLDSFVILICVKGKGTITFNDGSQTSLDAGETVLLPAATGALAVRGVVTFLETYIG